MQDGKLKLFLRERIVLKKCSLIDRQKKMLFLFFRIYEILSNFSGRPPATAAVGPSEGQENLWGQFIYMYF